MSALLDCLEDAVLGTLRESGLVLDAVQLAERLSVLPSDVEQATAVLVRSGVLRASPSMYGTCYAVPRVTRRRGR